MTYIVNHSPHDVKYSHEQILNFPNSKLMWKTNNEYGSVCPFCHGGEKHRHFRYWPDVGNYWCRACYISGFVNGQAKRNPEQLRWLQEQQVVREAHKRNRQKTALETLWAVRPDLTYARNLNGHSETIYHRWGLNEWAIDYFGLGYREMLPIAKENEVWQYTDSISIPYYYTPPNQEKPKLYNLKHRCLTDDSKGRYRSEMSGLPSLLFNADLLKNEDTIIIIEGEFKTMVTMMFSFPAVGLDGASKFQPKWAKHFKDKKVYIALDRNAMKHAWKIGKGLTAVSRDVRVCSMPFKPDDMLTLYGYSPKLFGEIIEGGRPV